MTESPVAVLAEKLDALEEHGPKQLFGVFSGTVVDVLDPLALGRVRVRVPTIDSIDPLPWARIAVPMAGFGAVLPHGTYFIPDLNTEVLVAFENGELDSPYVIGCLWNALARPPLPSPLLQIRVIRTPLGNQIVFTESPPTVTIQSGPTPPVPIPAPGTPASPPPTILLSPDGVTITSPVKITLAVGTSSITLMPQGILIFGAEVSMTAGAQATISAGMVRINS